MFVVSVRGARKPSYATVWGLPWNSLRFHLPCRM